MIKIKGNNKFGFTLVELLAVIVILAIILVMAVPKVMNVIEDAKKATLESTAKMIADQAEKQKVQNTVLGKTEEITCESVAKINDVDYASCEITFEDNTAKVTIEGSGKFEGLYVCNGTKTDASAQSNECNVPPTIEKLQVQYEFTYYSTMHLAVNDVNNATIGASADIAEADKDSAVAGVYTDEQGAVSVVLLKDHTEATRIKPSVDMTINLGGHTFTVTEDRVGINIKGKDIVIDGRLSGSCVRVESLSVSVRAIQVASGGNSAVINGGQYLAIRNGGSDSLSTNGIFVGVSSSAIVSDCDIRAYFNYNYGEGISYSEFSVGVNNDGQITLNNCYVMGTHSGLSNSGTLCVNGGTYEGYGHGGFYFSEFGSGNTVYVRNATIRECDMPDGYTATSNDNNAGFYIGGAANANNITVYMDNCDIYGSSQPIVLRGSSGEQNNSLYISNSRINTDKKIRIDNDTHKLYIGAGNNFTADNTDRPSAVVTTNEVYAQ